jgi:hypothetical protein
VLGRLRKDPVMYEHFERDNQNGVNFVIPKDSIILAQYATNGMNWMDTLTE